MMLASRCCAQGEVVEAPAPVIQSIGESAWIGGVTWPATCVAPTSIAVGNLLVAFVVIRTEGAAFNYTVSSGWTQVFRIENTLDIYYEVLYRVADGGSNDTLVLTRPNTSNFYVAAHVLRVSNASTVVAATSAISSSTTTPECPSLAVAGGNDCIWLSTLASPYNRPTVTPPSGYTFTDIIEASGRPYHYMSAKDGNTGTEAAHSFVNVTSGFYGVAATVCIY